jgi:DNA-binding LacI/PurR family transcriptional regulator
VKSSGKASSPSATINDVALRAGVGKGTVSRVLNGGSNVSAGTRARVEAAIADLGFAPSYAAQSLARGRVATVVVVVPFVTHPSAVSRVQGVIEGLRPSGRPVSILDVETPGHARAHFLTLLGSLRPEGVIVVSLTPDDDLRRRLLDADFPVVWLDTKVHGQISLFIDNVEGGRLAADHLLSLGHRAIAFIGDDEAGSGFGFTSARDRFRGVTTALAKHGLEPAGCLTGPHSKDVARRLALQLLTGADRPTAIVTTSDTQALGVLAAARELGVDVPGELSVVGFDDLEIAETAGLSTIRQPIVESGRRAAQLIMSLADGKQPPRRHVALPLQLVERQSTGAARTAPVQQPAITT